MVTYPSRVKSVVGKTPRNYSWKNIQNKCPVFFWSEQPPPHGYSKGSAIKEFTCYAGELGSILITERFAGGGNGNSLQYSFLENHMDVRVHRAPKSQTQLSMHTKQQPQITVYWGSEMKINPKRKQTFLIIHMMDQTFNNLMIHFIFEVFENRR